MCSKVGVSLRQVREKVPVTRPCRYILYVSLVTIITWLLTSTLGAVLFMLMLLLENIK